MFPDDVVVAAEAIVAAAKDRGLMLATAESCTGGLVAAALTEIAGSSAAVDRGFVTYSNAAKVELLGVSPATLDAYGAVSEPVAGEMARGAVARSGAAVAVAVTGIAGPGGGSADKPVGLVHFAVSGPGDRLAHQVKRFGDLGRAQVRLESLRTALALLDEALAA